MNELIMTGGTSTALARPCPHQLDMTHLQRVQNKLQGPFTQVPEYILVRLLPVLGEEKKSAYGRNSVISLEAYDLNAMQKVCIFVL